MDRLFWPSASDVPADDRARLLAEVIGQSSEFVAWHGPIGAEARINRAGAALVGGGVTADEPLPVRVRDLFVDEDRELIESVGVPEMERSGFWRAGVRIRNRDTGEIRSLAFSMFLVRDPEGRVLGSAGMGRDVTEQTRATAELEAAHAQLEAVHAELARVNEELRTAAAAAGAANAAKNEFLSRMSHELRTPLNAVLGYAQLLEMDVPADQREKVGQITRAGRHLLELINDVLDISTIESGHLPLSLEPVHMGELAAEAVELMGPLAERHSVGIRQEPCRSAPHAHAHADRRRTLQILLNLMSNAIKYNRRGGTVRLRWVSGVDEIVRIDVEDNGIGIPAEHLDRLFVPFDRLGAAGTSIEGTGVGLALSQRLAAAMGGTIAVRSQEGQGSTFTLTLPATGGPPGTAPAANAQYGRGCSRGARARTVLSVEDNLANSRLLDHVVARRPGWNIVHAGLGRLGFDLAVADPPDLVLLDLHLPDISGDEVLRRLKANPATRDVPVVILSADATHGQVGRLHALGALAYLTKPVDVHRLLELLDTTAAGHPAP